MMASGDENASETGDLPRGFASRVEEIYVNHGRNASAVAYFIAAELGSEYPKILLRISENKLRSLAEKLRIFGFESNGYDTREELAQNISAKVAKMLAQGITGITNDEEPNGDSSEDTDVGEALAGAKEEQTQGFRPPGASTVAGAPGAVFPAVFGHTAPVVGGDGRKQLANAGRSLANAAGASFGGGEGVSAVPRSGTLKAGARGGGKEEKAGLPRSAKGDGAAGMGLSPEMMAQMNALVGGFQQLGIGGAQGLGAAVRVPAPSVQEAGAWGGAGAAGPSPAGWTSGPHGYPGTPTGVDKTLRQAYAYPGQMGAAWPQPYPPAGTAYGTWVPAAGWDPVPHGVRSSPSVVWDVEDHKYHQRMAPKHMETAIQGHNGNMVAWLNVQRAPVLRQ
eukprot:jgi/Mesvir1/19874/Mv13162-RA.1